MGNQKQTTIRHIKKTNTNITIQNHKTGTPTKTKHINKKDTHRTIRTQKQQRKQTSK